MCLACRFTIFCATLLTSLQVGTLVYSSSAETPATMGPIRFRDAQPAAGVKFTLENSPTSNKYLPETMAGGVAAFDYDGDGLTDIFFANGANMPELRKDGPSYSNRLFRN